MRGLLAAAAVSLAIAFYVVCFGPFSLTLAGRRVSSWEWHKPLRNGLLCATVALWLHDSATPASGSWNRLAKWAPILAAGSAAVLMGLAARFGIFVAGGADAYGYVSQALLWASGRLTLPDPLASLTSVLGPSIAPIGYRLSNPPGSIVTTYASGLPMVMAAAVKIGGTRALYAVVPVFGGLGVWLSYALAVRLAGRRTGFITAVLVSCSPIFLFSTLEPMSDIPAATWWLAAWLAAISEGLPAAWLAGLAASAAILTRPNLVPLAAVVALAVMTGPRRLVRFACFAFGVVPGCLAVAALNQRFYGSPFSSGYGPLAMLFSWSRVVANLQRYPVWLIQLHTVGILLALAAPFVIRRETDASGSDTFDPRVMATLMLAFSAVLLFCYLFWIPYDDWAFLRFMLPAIPLLLLLTSGVIVTILNRMPLSLRTAGALLVCIVLGSWYLTKARSLNVFATARSEHRYVAVGEFIAKSLPPNATFLSVIESGSVRFYGQRSSVRWDMLEPAQFDAALRILQEAGFQPYILVEAWEEDLFRTRFGGDSLFGRLDWPPAFEYRGPIDVRIFSPDDRAGHLAGRKVETRQMPSG